MKTFFVQTLGCKVNQYESEQVAAFLRARGLQESQSSEHAELRIINTCSVTVQAASQSRQSVRRATRLPVLTAYGASSCGTAALGCVPPEAQVLESRTLKPRIIVIGCWATSDKPAAAALNGVDAVLTHQDDLAAELDRLLSLWKSHDLSQDPSPVTFPPTSHSANDIPQRPMDQKNKEEPDNAAAEHRPARNKPIPPRIVNEIPATFREGEAPAEPPFPSDAQAPSRVRSAAEPRISFRTTPNLPENPLPATVTLPLLSNHQSGRQRAFLKIQDGCDAHCTYCIIPKLRPALASKPIEDAVLEAQKLVDSGHSEIVLTGIFLGAYGHPTALRRFQVPDENPAPLAQLIENLCTRVPGLLRLRLSSLEPGDLDDRLLSTLASHPQVVPHFHLPLQSGSDLLLRRMNRQYRRDDFLRLLDRITRTFDRPALTTDIIVAFPGESDEQFQLTLDVVHAARFIHIHAFPFSPRPGTAAARWKQDVPGTVANQRIRQLTDLAARFNRQFRETFVASEVSVITERGSYPHAGRPLRRGRCERYFAVDFDAPDLYPGDLATVRIDSVSDDRTIATLVHHNGGAGRGAA
jgi:threonylcarbamoyladenosine tRNA methylthiotransferase MtaB